MTCLEEMFGLHVQTHHFGLLSIYIHNLVSVSNTILIQTSDLA